MPVIRASERYFMDVMFLLRRCVEDMNQANMFHWNSAYPSARTIMDDIEAGTLFIYIEHGVCKGMIVLNESPSDEYRDVEWELKSGKILIVHRLAVNPVFQGRGIGRKLMEFAVHYARKSGYSAIRLDVIENNLMANDLYRGMGFRKAGTFHFPFQKAPFICYELSLKG